MSLDATPIPRVIPVLLLDDDGMVKTVRYTDPTYVGDPVNVINLFNRFEVDEIALLNIRATVGGTAVPFALIEELASECWVPTLTRRPWPEAAIVRTVRAASSSAASEMSSE